jgi:hypothetical protein
LKKGEPILSNPFAETANLEPLREPFFFRAYR